MTIVVIIIEAPTGKYFGSRIWHGEHHEMDFYEVLGRIMSELHYRSRYHICF